MTKHFNAGNVWGKVLELKEGQSQGGTPYLLVTINCSGKYGSVRAYGRLFGQEKINGVIDFHKANPGVTIRFRGYMGQYVKRDEIFSNFTFYAWEPAEGQNHRAAFVLVGRVTELTDFLDMQRVCLHLTRNGQSGYSDTEEDFTLWSYDAGLFTNMMIDQVVEFKGCMQQGQGEDEFGASTGEVRPIVLRSRIVEGF